MTEQEMEQLMQRLSAGREYRLMQSFSVRSNSNDDSGMIADGYATTFNQPYLLYDFGDYKVYEQIDSRAFDDCDMSDVIMQYDHRGRVFARTSNKTLELNPDNIGLYFRADLSDHRQSAVRGNQWWLYDKNVVWICSRRTEIGVCGGQGTQHCHGDTDYHKNPKAVRCQCSIYPCQ
jgi:hypothetical protein